MYESSVNSKIVILDYGMGNLGSVLNMLRKIGADALISADPDDVLTADKLILPGVGSFDRGMKNLRERNFLNPLHKAVLENKKPVLGICLGFQLMTRSSEEGTEKGLGWLSANTVRFRQADLSLNPQLKIPHMGWKNVAFNPYSKLFQTGEGEIRFYFVHSYHVACDYATDISATAMYGEKEFVASCEREYIFGTQFHPEKSHKYGAQLLRNFIAL
jgi:imidazole glycerol-phosphate synthase subunit HisH